MQPVVKRVAVALVVLTVVGVGGLAALSEHAMSQEPPSYSCSGQLSVSGTPEPGQVGLVKCYVKAVRTHDTRLLSKIETSWDPYPLPAPRVGREAIAAARFFNYDAGMGDERVTVTFSTGATMTVKFGEAPSSFDVAIWRLEPPP